MNERTKCNTLVSENKQGSTYNKKHNYTAQQNTILGHEII